MTNYNELLNESNTVACRDLQEGRKAQHSAGHYEQKAYNPTIKLICEVDSLILRTVETSITTKYEILWEGAVFNRYPNMKTAENMFMDLAGITKKKFEKLTKAMA